MNTNLSNSSRSSSTVQNQSLVGSGVGSGVGGGVGGGNYSSNNMFQKSMIGRVHLSKPGCSSCGH